MSKAFSPPKVGIQAINIREDTAANRGAPDKWPSRTQILLLALPLLFVVTMAAGLFFFNLDTSTKATFWWFVVAIVVLVHSFLQGQTFNNLFKQLYTSIKEEVHSSSDKNQKEIIQIIEAKVDPNVTVLQSLKEVRFAAADLIEKEIKNKNDPDSEVCYLGSASLTPSDRELRGASHSEQDELSDVVRYQNALTDLRESDIKVSRFIRLLEPDRFVSRDAKTRVEYLTWLESQVARLGASQKYVLYDCRRAPEWGGPRSSIVSTGGLVDIIGNGDAGLYLTSNRIPKVLLRESKQFFWKARRPENKPEQYSADHAHKLERLLRKMKELHEKCVAQEKK